MKKIFSLRFLIHITSGEKEKLATKHFIKYVIFYVKRKMKSNIILTNNNEIFLLYLVYQTNQSTHQRGVIRQLESHIKRGIVILFISFYMILFKFWNFNRFIFNHFLYLLNILNYWLLRFFLLFSSYIVQGILLHNKKCYIPHHASAIYWRRHFL